MAKQTKEKTGTASKTDRRVRSINPLSLDEKFTGTEPLWNTEAALKYDQATFDRHLRTSLNWYNYYNTTKTTKKYLVDWLRKNTDLTVAEITAFDRSADKYTSMTACGLVLAHRRGMPIREREHNWLVKHVRDVLRNSAKDIVIEPTQEAKIVAPAQVTTIQDRLNEKLSEFIGELEGRFDDAVTKKVAVASGNEFFKSMNVPQALIKRIHDHFERRLTEFRELQASKDAYVKESYRQFKAADWRRVIAWLEGLLADCNSYTQLKRATRKPRAPKAMSREKIVSKLKFLKEDPALKVASINPTEIIGAKELWCFNTQTRKLYRYVADSQIGSLGVKGSSIVGYDTSKSVGKTLRKPSEQLKEFAKSGKVALRTFLDKIRATETLANGRLNQYTLLLKVG